MNGAAETRPRPTALYVILLVLVAIPLILPGLCSVVFIIGWLLDPASGSGGYDELMYLVWAISAVPTVIGVLLARWLIGKLQPRPDTEGQDTPPAGS